jgi:hypothetical protein
VGNNLPVACGLDSRALARRQSELRDGVLAEAESVQRLPDGYRWRFRHDRELFARLGPIIDAERRCCPFLRFTITADPSLGTVTVDITGPAGTGDLLETWIPDPRPPTFDQTS